MVATLLLTLALSAGPQPVRLAAPSLSGINLSQDELNFYTDHLAQQLGFQGVRVTTSSEIQQLLGFERQKQLLGCSDSSASCMAELANALGVDGIVTGSIGKIGSAYQLNLKIIAAGDGAPLAAYSARAKQDEAVLDELTRGAKSMASELFKKLGKTPLAQASDAPKPEPVEVAAAETRTETTALRRWSFVPMGAGVIAASVGTYFILHGNGAEERIANAGSLDVAKQKLSQGQFEQQLGGVLVGVGVAAAAAGAAMYLFGGSSETSVAIIPGASPSVALGGVFDFQVAR